MPALNRQTIEVLLVEDDRDDADTIRDYLASAPGLDVRLHRAETLAGAEARLREGRDLDLVILDLTMPDAAGTQTLDRVADIAPRLPIVVLTALEDTELAWEAVRRGAADYLLKDDLTPDLLLRSLRYALDRAESVRRQRESEEWFRALVENVSDIVAVLDPEGHLRYVSPSQGGVLGYAPGSCLGQSILELVAPEHLHEVRALLGQLLEGGQSVTFQIPVRNAAGDWRILAGDARNLLDVPAMRGVIVTARDVTTSVERERLLLRQTDELTERIKEQQCLYRVLNVLHAAAPTPVAAFDEVVAAIPAGFQYPPSTAARLRVHDRSWSSPGFRETPWQLAAPVRTGSATVGTIEVVRTGLAEDEDAPFLPEEQALIRAIAGAIADALELARVEEELRGREAYFRTITDHSNDTLLILDRDLVPQYMSLAGVRALGPGAVEQGESEGPWPQLYERVYPDDLEPLRALLKELSAVPGDVRRTEVRVLIRDEWRTLDLAVRNLLDDPAVGGIIVNARDITERRNTEERYRTLFQTTRQGVTYQDADGVIVSANPAAEQILGLSVDQMVGRKGVDPRWRTLRRDGSQLPGDEHPSVVALRTGGSVEGAVMGVFNPHEERTRWISVDSRPQFRPGETEPYQVYSTFTDITERVENEEALRRKDAILEAVSVAAERFLAAGPDAEAMDDVLGAVGTATGVSSVDVWKLEDSDDPDATDTLQYRWIAQGSSPDVAGAPRQPLPAELKWREPLERGAVVHGRRDTLPLPAGAALESMGIRAVALLPVIVGGALWGCLRLVDRTADRIWSPAEIDALKAAASILAAALQRRRDEDALRQRDQQLLQAQKMEAVGRLAGGIAHDFNNLLTAVSGYADLARDESGDPRVAGHMAEIRKAADRGAGLTRQLLAFGRQTLVEVRVMDLAHVVREMEPMLDRLLGERIQMESVIERQRFPVRMDPSQVEQMVMNLVLNARDAVDADGRIRVCVGTTEIRDEHARAMLPDRPPPGRYAALSVEDDGVGMDGSVLEHVFEPFFTTKGPGRGTGLGLSTVYGIVRDAGGFIDVRSEPGAGSRFTILVPAADGDVEAVAAAPSPATRQEAGTGVILVVEDEAAVRAVAVRALRRSGYTVLEAGSGAEALTLVESSDTRFDLLLSDVVMPGVSGVTLSGRLREIVPGLRVILTSGYAQDELGEIDLEESAIAFLPKPYTPASLVAKVVAVMRSDPASGPDGG